MVHTNTQSYKSIVSALRAAKQKNTLPVKAGRSSVSESAGIYGGIFDELAIITPDYPVQMLNALEHLATYNGDVSYGIDNIVQLGNTFKDDFKGVFFDDAVSDEQSKEMIAHLKSRSRHWYTHSGGINSLINDYSGKQLPIFSTILLF